VGILAWFLKSGKKKIVYAGKQSFDPFNEFVGNPQYQNLFVRRLKLVVPVPDILKKSFPSSRNSQKTAYLVIPI
jgi:hypothetical protein